MSGASTTTSAMMLTRASASGSQWKVAGKSAGPARQVSSENASRTTSPPLISGTASPRATTMASTPITNDPTATNGIRRPDWRMAAGGGITGKALRARYSSTASTAHAMASAGRRSPAMVTAITPSSATAIASAARRRWVSAQPSPSMSAATGAARAWAHGAARSGTSRASTSKCSAMPDHTTSARLATAIAMTTSPIIVGREARNTTRARRKGVTITASG